MKEKFLYTVMCLNEKRNIITMKSFLSYPKAVKFQDMEKNSEVNKIIEIYKATLPLCSNIAHHRVELWIRK
jgi:hypothetical protein